MMLTLSSGVQQRTASVCSPSGRHAFPRRVVSTRFFSPASTSTSRLPTASRVRARKEDSSDNNSFQDSSPNDDDSQHELGSFLQSFGVESDPTAFVNDVFVLASVLDIAVMLVTFWGLQHYGGWSVDDAGRAASGLGLGLLTRPFVETEHIFMPLYTDFIKAMTSMAVVEPSSYTQDQLASTINKVGGLLFVGFLLPQVLLHLTAGEAAQIVVPMAGGWLVFDLAIIIALLVKLRLI